MYAALKDDCIEYVIWEGVGVQYPGWFHHYLDEREGYVDEYGYFYLDPNEPLTETVDVFILNNRGDVERLDIVDFEKYFIKLNFTYAALKEYTVQYLVWYGQRTVCPGWFMEHISYGFITRSEYGWLFLDESGEILMSPSCVFIYNGKDMYYLETALFNTLYHTAGGVYQ